MAVFYLVGLFEPLEEAFVDWEQRLIAVKESGASFALIAIERIPSDRPWPWPRLDYALLLRGLIPELPQSVVFEPDMHDEDPHFSSFDAAFSRRVDRVDNVVFSAEAMQVPDGSAVRTSALPADAVTLRLLGARPRLVPFASVLWPVRTFSAHRPVGIANFDADRDQIVRRLPLVFRIGDRIVPSLALTAAGVRLGADWSRSTFAPGGEIILRDHTAGTGRILRRIPVDSEGRLRLRLRKPGLTALRINYDDFLLYADERERGVTPAVDLTQLARRQVWVGATDPAAGDPKRTVLGPMAPVEIQLRAAAQIVRGEFIAPVPGLCIALLFAVTGSLMACLAQSLAPGRAAAAIGGLIAAIFALGIIAFELAEVSFPLVSLAILGLGAFLAGRAAGAWEWEKGESKS